MSENAIRELIDTIISRTREGKIKWEWDSVNDQSFTDLLSGRVIVGKDSDDDAYIRIQDTEGMSLEYINVGFPEYRQLMQLASDLSELARRSALQIDSKLGAILRELTAIPNDDLPF